MIKSKWKSYRDDTAASGGSGPWWLLLDVLFIVAIWKSGEVFYPVWQPCFPFPCSCSLLPLYAPVPSLPKQLHLLSFPLEKVHFLVYSCEWLS